MGQKIITEKDFWICTEGMVPAQMQSTQIVAQKRKGERYITVRDTATSSWIDFSCTKGMIVNALIAAVVAVVIVAAVITTGGAALLAVGLVAGLAGGLITAVKGALDCGHKMAPQRVWNNPKTDLIILGAETITGDCTMTCPKGGTVKFAPEIKNWAQAYFVGAANFVIKMTECGLVGAGVGLAAPAIIPLFTGGATASLSLGAIGTNFAGSFTGAFGALRAVSALDQLPNQMATGESAGTMAKSALFGGIPEAEFIHRIAAGGRPRPADALLLLYLLHIEAKKPVVAPEGEPAPAPKDEPNAPPEEEPAKPNEEVPPPIDEAPPSESAPQDGEFDAFEDPTPVNEPEFETITLADGTRVKRLTPNSDYTANGYNYRTDAQGRIIEANGRLRLGSEGRNPYAQRTVGRNDGRLATDHGGHLFGDQFGGAGGKENMVPMDAQVNNYQRGQWGRMEHNWAEQIRQGNQVDVRIEPRYGDNTIRPTHFDVTETINGNTRNITIQNTSP